jgi:hypothetical protein
LLPVTGVQTCALPISPTHVLSAKRKFYITGLADTAIIMDHLIRSII